LSELVDACVHCGDDVLDDADYVDVGRYVVHQHCLKRLSIKCCNSVINNQIGVLNHKDSYYNELQQALQTEES
jgi:hypothetical protein